MGSLWEKREKSTKLIQGIDLSQFKGFSDLIKILRLVVCLPFWTHPNPSLSHQKAV